MYSETKRLRALAHGLWLQENVSKWKAMTVVTDICFDGNSTLDRKWMTSVA
jgi:hypothetical protein